MSISRQFTRACYARISVASLTVLGAISTTILRRAFFFIKGYVTICLAW